MMLHAAVYKTVNVTAGGLSAALTTTEKSTITDLTVTGTIDARDVKVMRDIITNLAVLNLSGANILAYTGTAGTVAVSTTFPANKMPKNSFCNIDYSVNATLKSVVLPNSITSIGSYVFFNCTGLTSITIPNAVTLIEDYAFYGCSGFTNLTIPNTVKSIGTFVFSGCTGLTGITLPNAITSIGDWTFGNCSRLSSLSIPNTVTTIGIYAFYNCTSLTNLIVPNSVQFIGKGTFSNCAGLTNITLPNTINSIENGTFTDCIGLTSVTIPASVDSIGTWAFSGCKKLLNLTIPQNVTKIGSGAFYDCAALASLNIPESVKTIGSGAFSNCTGLTNITIPSVVKVIENSTFSNCKGLTKMTIPNAVTSIGDWAFYNCKGLTSLTFGDSITSIGIYAFSDCSGLSSIYNYDATPISLASSTYLSVNKGTCTLYVPTNSKTSYQSTSAWNEFTNIVEMSSVLTQQIPLAAGWNILSSNVIPANIDLKVVFKSLMDDGKLIKVMDESGKAIENFAAFGGWNNDIGNFSKTEGYRVNMTSTDTLKLEGTAINLPLDIKLNAGWNIISYPGADMQNAMTLIQPLINGGKLKKVMDESGKSIENFGAFGGWKNNIGNFNPGKGFKICMNASDTLAITSTLLRSETSIFATTDLGSSYFTKIYEGNGTNHMNINLVDLASSTLKDGNEIGIFDGDNCVGTAKVGSTQLAEGFISVPASCNDGLNQTVNGYIPGHTIGIKLYSDGSYYNLKLENLLGNGTFEKDGSLFAKVLSKDLTSDISKNEELVQIGCYPNPFVEEITITFKNKVSTEVNVGIYNLSGQKIKGLYNGNTDSIQLNWNGTDEKDNKVIPGVYLCKVNNSTIKVVYTGQN